MTISVSNIRTYNTIDGWQELLIPDIDLTSYSLLNPIDIDHDINGSLTSAALITDVDDNLYISGSISGTIDGFVNLKYDPLNQTTQIMGADLTYYGNPVLADNVGEFKALALHNGVLYCGGSLEGSASLFSYDGSQWNNLNNLSGTTVDTLTIVNPNLTAVPVNITPTTYDSDALTLFGVVEGYGDTITYARKKLISDTITSLKTANLWNKLDKLIIKGNTGTSNIALYDMKQSTAYNITPFVPSTDAVAMTADDASIGVYIPTLPTYIDTVTDAFSNIAVRDNLLWMDMDSGTNGFVYDIKVDSNDNVYVVGDFTSVGSTPTTVGRIAMWNGTWNTVGTTSTNDIIYCIAFDSAGNLYVGGYFTSIGGVSANRVAKWDGASWSALGTGLTGGVAIHVRSIVFDSADNMYVTGRFTTAGGISASNIAKWNGASWSALGTGLSSTGNALAVDSADNVYVAGHFNSAGGISVSNIAKWNGASWSALGTGIEDIGEGTAIVIDNSDNVYVAGHFNSAGGITVSNGVAKWDGASWSALGTGDGGIVEENSLRRDIALWNGEVYVSGYFTDTFNNNETVKRWDGIQWFTEAVNTTQYYATSIDFNSQGRMFIGGGFSSLTQVVGCPQGVQDNTNCLTLLFKPAQGQIYAKVNSNEYSITASNTLDVGLIVATNSSNEQQIWINGVSQATNTVTTTSLPTIAVENDFENRNSQTVLSLPPQSAYFVGSFLTDTEQLQLKTILENYFNTTTYQ